MLNETFRGNGRPVDSALRYEKQFSDAGFVDVQVIEEKWPTNRWPRDPGYTQVGKSLPPPVALVPEIIPLYIILCRYLETPLSLLSYFFFILYLFSFLTLVKTFGPMGTRSTGSLRGRRHHSRGPRKRAASGGQGRRSRCCSRACGRT